MRGIQCNAERMKLYERVYSKRMGTMREESKRREGKEEQQRKKI